MRKHANGVSRQRIRELHATYPTASAAEIARALGLSRSYVSEAMREEGLKPAPKARIPKSAVSR